jgi:NAD-dependent SIR2 family protein deacetylase
LAVQQWLPSGSIAFGGRPSHANGARCSTPRRLKVDGFRRLLTISSKAAIDADDFARRFSVRAGNLMWLLGAGASAAAGIPTAWDMIWEFKQRIYVSQKRVSLESVTDLGNPAIRAQLQSYFDASGTFPATGSPEEYANLFEAAWPNEGDRQTYISGKIAGAKPSYGHFALATFMLAKLTKLVWTTNFDTLIADACAKVYDGTGALTTVALDAPALASEALSGQRWPVEVKLHGDFRSRRLKNTGDELRQQDAVLRRALVDACRTSGLIVAGYSGRDDSVMDALADAVAQPNSFPAGLFWLHKGENPPLPRVTSILESAAQKGIDGGLVHIENFDEALRDLVRLMEGLNTEALEQFATSRKRWTAPPEATGRKRFPVVRLNGLPMSVSPTVCRRVVCNIGGYSEITAAVAAVNVDIVVGRTRSGVLAFGSDADVRAAFSPFGITEFDLHAIETHRLRYDSGERGLLREALSRALAREGELTRIRRRVTDLLMPAQPDDSSWADLQKIVGSLTGTVRGHPELVWREGVGVRLEWAEDRVWLVFEPRMIFEGIGDDNRFAATDFARERTVKRYNRVLNDLIAFWASRLARDGTEQRALDVSAGVDAVFNLSSNTAYSRRIGA